MFRLKCSVSGFDGRQSYKAGDVIHTTPEHAKTVVALGHGVLVDDQDKELTGLESARVMGLVPAAPVDKV